MPEATTAAAPAAPEAESEQPPSATAPASAVQRAEALLDRLGDAARRRAESVAPEDTPPADATKNGAPQSTATPESPSAAVDHAEVLLDEMGQRIGALATVLGKRMRKAAARAWEELEDIYAEAEALRGDSGGKGGGGGNQADGSAAAAQPPSASGAESAISAASENGQEDIPSA